MSPEKRRPINPSAEQMGYTQDEEFQIPYYLGEDYRLESNYLADQRLWGGYFASRKGEKKCTLLDLKRSLAFVFNPYNWQAERVESLVGFNPDREIQGVLIASSAKQERQVEDLIEKLGLMLSQASPVYVFEERRGDSRKGVEAREKILRDLGLVAVKILTRPSPQKEAEINHFRVWRSRMAKMWQPRRPVDITGSQCVIDLLNRVKRRCEKAGCTEVDTAPIEAWLRATTFPLATIWALRDYWLIRMKTNCGCQWMIDRRGDPEIDQCDPDCPTIDLVSESLR